jgi:hypothetical protein
MHEVWSITSNPPEPDDRTHVGQRLIVDGQIQHGRGHATAGWAAGLNRLEGVTVDDAATNVVDNLADGDAERHFDQAGVVDLASQGTDLRAAAALRAEARVHSPPFMTIGAMFA